MYKVFVNDVPLLLTDSINDYEQFSGEKNKYSSTNDLKFQVNELEKGRYESLLIFHTSLEELWNNFRSLYEYIIAAGGIVKNKNEEYLFIFRNGKWDIPKGKMDKGETPIETALREVEEECGINKLTIGDKLMDTYHTYEFKGKPVLKRTYWYFMESEYEGELVPQIEEGITIVTWLKPDQFEKIHQNTFKGIEDVLNKFSSLRNLQ